MEMAADRTGGMAGALQAALRLGNVAFAATWNQRAAGSLPGIRSRCLRPRLEMQ
jgi:hypothetical protein